MSKPVGALKKGDIISIRATVSFQIDNGGYYVKAAHRDLSIGTEDVVEIVKANFVPGDAVKIDVVPVFPTIRDAKVGAMVGDYVIVTVPESDQPIVVHHKNVWRVEEPPMAVAPPGADEPQPMPEPILDAPISVPAATTADFI